jgi:monoamine oxidase
MTLARRTFLASSASLAAPKTLHAKTEADVIVIGAGLSGLYAARLLADEGAKVVVDEGRNRVGGRLESYRHLEGAPEAGGDSILGG